jgi:hypothetical protein
MAGRAAAFRFISGNAALKANYCPIGTISLCLQAMPVASKIEFALPFALLDDICWPVPGAVHECTG